MARTFLFCILLGVSTMSFCYDRKTDSLSALKFNKEFNDILFSDAEAAMQFGTSGVKKHRSQKNSRTLIEAYIACADAIEFQTDYKKAITYLDTAIGISSEKYPDLHAKCIARKGIQYSNLGDYDTSVEYYKKALEIARKIDHKKLMATSYANMGVSYYQKSDYPKAIEYYMKGLSILEEIKDSVSISVSASNLGVFYDSNGQFEKALESYKKSLKYLRPNQLSNYGQVYSNMGNIFSELKMRDSSLHYHHKALDIATKLNDVKQLVLVLNNIGALHLQAGEYQKAYESGKKALDYARMAGLALETATFTKSLAIINFHLKRYDESEKLALESLKLNRKLQARDEVKQIYFLLGDLMKAKGDYKNAVEYFFSYKALNDSIFNEEYKTQLSKLEAEFESVKKEKEISLLKAGQKIADEQLQRKEAQYKHQKAIRNTFIAGFGGLLVISGLVYNGYRRKKKDNREITLQKHQIEEKNKDILDSIQYAKRIQQAMLVPEQSLQETFPGSFVLYKPKDIVSGDFYWIKEHNGFKFCAVADCTGHGVPGAFMSVLGYNSLDRCITEFGLVETNEILDRLNTLIRENLSNTSSMVRDGMDICIIRIDEKTNTLQYSGAHNSLWIFLNGADEPANEHARFGDHTLIELKADKQPIGNYESSQAFTCKAFELKKGDALYLSSDGYADQFGGDKGKKFTSRKFKELVASVQTETPSRQKELLLQAHETYKDQLEQIDDICVVGIRVG